MICVVWVGHTDHKHGQVFIKRTYEIVNKASVFIMARASKHEKFISKQFNASAECTKIITCALLSSK